MDNNMRAFLEQNEVGDWFDDFVYHSKYRLIDMGFEVIAFNGDDPDALFHYDLDAEKDIVIGSVESSIKFFEQSGMKTPNALGYPKEIIKFMGRNVEETTFGKLLVSDRAYPYFIKPSKEVKLFTGDIIEKESFLDTLKLLTPNLNSDTELYLSTVIDIVSEYRCFVFNDELEGIHYYLGDFRKYPDTDVIDQIISEYKSSPVAYTVDVGVTASGDTILVEVNDMWAIGSYGFDPKMYALMCVRRMKEILLNIKL